ncbi:hypothetical protein [Paraburkholderia gardini]|nr:hypothetical protein [Paraburkholderia gardini]
MVDAPRFDGDTTRLCGLSNGLGSAVLPPVHKLNQAQLPDLTVIHRDGTTTAAKKGGDDLGYIGHKHLKGDKVVAFRDRRCNVIAPFVSAPGNRNESPSPHPDCARANPEPVV